MEPGFPYTRGLGISRDLDSLYYTNGNGQEKRLLDEDDSIEAGGVTPEQAALIAQVPAKLNSSEVGVSVAPLSGGLVPAIHLPAFVDEIVEYANTAAFPGTGASGIIYVAVNSPPGTPSTIWRWSGTQYTQISASPGSTDAVPEGAANLYFTTARAIAAALTGLVTSNASAVVATDSLLIAAGKLQRQVTDLQTALGPNAYSFGSGVRLYPTTSAGFSVDRGLVFDAGASSTLNQIGIIIDPASDTAASTAFAAGTVDDASVVDGLSTDGRAIVIPTDTDVINVYLAQIGLGPYTLFTSDPATVNITDNQMVKLTFSSADDVRNLLCEFRAATSSGRYRVVHVTGARGA